MIRVARRAPKVRRVLLGEAALEFVREAASDCVELLLWEMEELALALAPMV